MYCKGWQNITRLLCLWLANTCCLRRSGGWSHMVILYMRREQQSGKVVFSCQSLMSVNDSNVSQSTACSGSVCVGCVLWLCVGQMSEWNSTSLINASGTTVFENCSLERMTLSQCVSAKTAVHQTSTWGWLQKSISLSTHDPKSLLNFGITTGSFLGKLHAYAQFSRHHYTTCQQI